MVQQIASFVAQVLLMKFAINDVPHALGLLGNPTVTSVSEDLKLTAYRAYTDLVDEKFGPRGTISLERIYFGVGYKKGLTREESDELVRKAMKVGYMRKSRVKLKP